MKKFIAEFKAFALKGNVIDLAIGVVIGGAFSTIVKSLVNDIIMPLVGMLIGGVNFQAYKIVLKHAVGTHPAVTLNIGNFIQNVINFLIIAITVFLCVKAASKLYKKKDAAPAKTPDDILLLQEIRDLLKDEKK
ncbi:large-conductance mechanosensitive channel protein MscL [uncultured Clostridium sp.]|jgi:large conductance mechanosensitive channel|uniref:large-conductance mechanosensitive channel protein MscL n=1 Tax=uncultured Clostridium sp. TaxID=59620 RepID=UPI00262EC453|nr:large-conductance mechanosensitive channel protein MscL [uncultured Clostridium sp.]